MRKAWGLVSFILFCIGLVLVIIGGIVAPSNVAITVVLAVFGLIIGIIYVVFAKGNGGLHTLLLSVIALLAMTAALVPITNLWSGAMVSGIIVNFAALMSPVALIAAIRALLTIGLEPEVKI